MNLQIVVMPGSYRLDFSMLRGVTQEFGWGLRVARGLDELRDARGGTNIGAVLFQRDSLKDGLGWMDNIRELQGVAPELRLVACNQFADTFDLPKLCRAGLFHALWLPLKQSEMRQCMGFVWEAEKRFGVVRRRAESERMPFVIRAAG